MRIQIPFSKTPIFSSNPSKIRLTNSVNVLKQFLEAAEGRVLVLTGAGISTDSGIPDYRGPNGTYTTNKTYRPIFYHEFIQHHRFRQRYWARSYFGFPTIAKALPNSAHYALTTLQNQNLISKIITQNVDGLHHNSGSRNILELHGTLHEVKCLQCGYTRKRTDFQSRLAKLNTAWATYSRAFERDGLTPRVNPDGDVEPPKDTSYDLFIYPSCDSCKTGIYKPSVVFFGENIHPRVKQSADEMIEECSALLIVGSSLATYSAFRLVKAAKEMGKPVGIVNLRSTRGDDLADFKIEERCSDLFRRMLNEDEKGDGGHASK
ncbi:7899_t:CDS:2 [Paraglomus brasilianum]|uniref:7899_t:CDS:1 n=1 Tax=Paraglomus brasilianum TaxID=144538 RepID=A0A9N9FHQ8_9GLOM|nr:7899_t:CDS:2 [Paraglomus brasilianum]